MALIGPVVYTMCLLALHGPWMCLDMCLDMYLEMYLDMCLDMCLDMYLDMSLKRNLPLPWNDCHLQS